MNLGTRTAQSARIRRAAMHFGSIGLGCHPAPTPPPTQESDTRDPISDLLSQLSNIRRTTSNTNNAQGHGQMHQIQVQLQLERQHLINRQLELVPRPPQRPIPLREFSFPSIENFRTTTIHLPPPIKVQNVVQKNQNQIKHAYLLDSLTPEYVQVDENQRELQKEYGEEIFIATAKEKLNPNCV